MPDARSRPPHDDPDTSQLDWRAMAVWACALLAAVPTPSEALRDDGRAVDVLHYDATVTPDVVAHTVSGVVRIRVRATARADDLSLDRGALEFEAATVDGKAADLAATPRRTTVRFAPPLEPGSTHEVEIHYRGTPGFGLQFPEGRAQVYTIFTTSDWMPSVDRPDDRATLRLRVVLPSDWRATGVGRSGPVTRTRDGRRVHEWRLDAPAPTYTFGFAAAPFTVVTSGRLRLLGDGFSAAELRRVFADTDGMLRFFERRAGVPFPHATYTQALVARTVGQEMSGLSLLSESYGRGVLADPSAITLAAHEAAHQWWGNLVTCEDWTHFWLNEGMATFMAAAYLETRFGRAAYDRAIAGFRAEYARVRDAGSDKPLVFPDWNRPTADDRALVYQKGALVLHELRTLLGDAAFWPAIVAYTRGAAGQSVTTPTFQRAIEAATGRDLADFFDRWVYVRTPRLVDAPVCAAVAGGCR
jgi:aminopeptidase N